MITPDSYAQAVRDALADLPQGDREELLEDLDDHLAEVAAESETPLEERLGPPEAYAAELRAAYGGRPAARGREGGRSRRVRAGAGRAHASMRGFPAYRYAVEFLPELRPGWWVVRGYVAAVLLLILGFGPRIAPENLAEWVVVLALVLVSVALGRWSREGSPPRWARRGLVAANVVAALALIPLVESAGSWNAQRADVYIAERPPGVVQIEMTESLGQGVYNIFPYAKDGTPLKNVLLYDQDGHPITVDPELYEYKIERVCDVEPPRANEYPLPLVSTLVDVPFDEGFDQDPCRHPVTPPPPAPSPAVTVAPSATANSTDSATPTADATPTPASTTPTSTDTPAPRRSPSPSD